MEALGVAVGGTSLSHWRRAWLTDSIAPFPATSTDRKTASLRRLAFAPKTRYDAPGGG